MKRVQYLDGMVKVDILCPKFLQGCRCEGVVGTVNRIDLKQGALQGIYKALTLLLGMNSKWQLTYPSVEGLAHISQQQ